MTAVGRRSGIDQARAMHSISTRAPPGSPDTPTAVRAGYRPAAK
jgi:hypothetical protein